MEIREKIKQAGLKATPQRRLVYQTLQELCHTNVDEIIAHVQAISPDVTVSTIYRILELFCSVGLLSRLNHPSGKTYYDITATDHHHIFMADNRIIDFEDGELTEFIIRKVEHKMGSAVKIDKISIQVSLE